MKLSKIAQSVEPSFTRQLFNMALKYDDVIDFTLGDPDYITPQNVRNAGCAAINSGKTKYSANAGLAELREAISNSVKKESGILYRPENEVIVTVGAMEALYLSLLCLLDEGDEVIIPAPFWINYKHMVQMCHATAKIIETDDKNDFIVDIKDIEAAVTPNTRAIIINSPNNPSGMIYDRDTVEQVCRIAVENDIVIYWDECYKSIVYDGNEVTSILEFPDMKEHSVIINSFSKKFSMTGWRIGYALAPKNHIEAMTKLQENIVACAALPSQYAAIKALTEENDECEKMRLGFQERRDVLIEGINSIPKLKCKPPKGTFYAFVNIRETGMTSVEFAYELLEKKHVAVVPGVTYGDCCEGYVRFAYTMDIVKIKEGIERIKEFTEELV